MAFLSFGSKRDKIKKMIEEEKFDEILKMAVKDKKALQALIELLDDSNPGIVGDALLLLSNVLEINPNSTRSHITPELFQKLMALMERKNPYVRENAMLLSYKIIKSFPEVASQHRDWIVEGVRRGLTEGNKDQKGFLLMVIGELGLKELRPMVEELVSVEDKVILPFEGKKWVPLGDIAKEVLEKLS
ncbi:hypothetical protein CL1_0176 [Thermococcus cleftensis]|uniref:HEAT repeat domain-containing protein n=1 Tax=Thermococcus cleftensis (strain DSM 27260 / KACC 17922 / CL1) TaxID=163003 RepID=I3ZRQ5_THECF|nr:MULTISPECIES: hypothetical protein [Thermococcus]AFL94389.1 hypothetical protein CL1_0176 [Thermococcus cleftensis]NJE03262.1 hypothetical protein [Thermococcus sp. MV11]